MLPSIGVGHNTRAYCPVVNQRPVGDRGVAVVDEYGRVHEVAGSILVTTSQLGYLADAAADWVLMTFTARLGVVGRPKPFASPFDLVKLSLVSKECSLVRKSVAVEGVVIAGRLGCSLTLSRSGPGKG